jgi:uridine phosphorylase
VLPVPAGPVPLARHLQKLRETGVVTAGQSVLVMGVCGGLVPDLAVSDRVVYQNCVSTTEDGSRLECDRALTEQIQQHLMGEIKVVQAVTSDRVVATPEDKQQLAQQFKADVVDMEGFPALSLLQSWGVAAAMVRVVSDDSHHAIPDLSSVFDANGSLRPLVLTRALIREPIAGFRLIQGSLRGIQELQAVTRDLFIHK